MPASGRRAAGASLALVLLCGGCELPRPPAAAAAHDTAVIDLDGVARGLGRDVVLREQLSSASKRLHGKLSDLASNLRERLEEEKGKLGEQPSEAAQEAFRKAAGEARAELQRQEALARQQTQRYQLRLVKQFREEVLPVARRIAQARGARVVIIKSSVLWYDPSTDITPYVVEAMRTAHTDPQPPSSLEGGRKSLSKEN